MLKQDVELALVVEVGVGDAVDKGQNMAVQEK